MNEIAKALDRNVAKNEDLNDHARVRREIEGIAAQVTALEALVNRRLMESLLRLETSWLAFEAKFLRLALSEHISPGKPKQTIETLADFEAALRSRPH